MVFDPKQQLADMASNKGGSRVKVGPLEALGAKPGSRVAPTKKRERKVPGFDKAQVKKL